MDARQRVYGGDTVEVEDGYVGVVRCTRYSLVGKETAYELVVPGTDHLDRSNTRTEPHSSLVRIVAHGQHDYRPNKEQRGSCARCGVKKASHDVV